MRVSIHPPPFGISSPQARQLTSLEVVVDSHTEQRGSGELIGVPAVIEKANAKRRRMNTDAETDREGTAARLLDTTPSVSL